MVNSFTLDRRVLLWQYAPVVFWIAVIFFLSSDQGSMSQTSRFIRPMLEFLFPVASEETLRIYHSYIRKAAHFTEYAFLAFLGVRALSLPVSDPIQKWRYLLAFVFVAMIAALDELNQSFVTTRTGAFSDVLLDISGGAAMVIFLWVFNSVRKPARQ